MHKNYQSFKMILGTYERKSLCVVLWRIRGMFCDDQREVKRSPKEFQSLSCMGGRPAQESLLLGISITDLHVTAISLTQGCDFPYFPTSEGRPM